MISRVMRRFYDGQLSKHLHVNHDHNRSIYPEAVRSPGKLLKVANQFLRSRLPDRVSLTQRE